MSVIKRLVVIPIILLAITAFAQQPKPTSAVATVEVKASVTEAEVGQQVKLTVVARDAAGNILNEQPTSFFAGPFDIAAADDNGVIRLFGPGVKRVTVQKSASAARSSIASQLHGKGLLLTGCNRPAA